ncbi:uncharacterized protein LOC122264331 isoform X2 [Penaeus japonicus]|uniref:uncharacterized protein LOC122264331 isoform X2 n=1 Tax=Penaeus japonicus TaxID=27405 RepID=UPI001C711787|nr:uncharacterized protein LOC122264331 isoform X2 [Penaeus japonicus]
MEVKVLGLLLLAVVGFVGSQNAYDDWNYDYRYDLYDYDEHENGGSENTDHVITHHERPEDDRQPTHRENTGEVHRDREQPVYSETEYETHSEVGDSVCALTCKASNESGPGIRYLPGHQYRYQYEGQVVSRARAAGSEQSSMSVRAYVLITANTPCDLKMQVMSLSVDDVPPNESAWFRDAVQSHELHFSYQDGEIEYLCPHQDEDAAATNFKRGILSALQVSVTNVDDMFEVVLQEADVAGECETRYHMTNVNDLVINKTKENCRSNAHLPYLPHSHYTTERINSELPFFRRDQSCQMFRSENIWERVECVEEVSVEGPFPSLVEQASLASLTITSSLQLQAGPEEAPGPFYEGEYLKRRESLRMDLEGAVDSAETRNQDDANVRDQIDVILEYLSATMTPHSGLEEGRPHAFSNLVNLLGRLRAEGALDDLWQANWQRDNYREFLLDAILLCEGSHCFRLVTRLAEDSNNLFDTRLRAWLAGIHFHANSDPESVQYLMELARTKSSMEDEIVMAASSMVHRLCQQNPKNECRGHKPFLEYVQEKIGNKCGYGEDRHRQDKVKIMLRALGNAGLLPYDGFPEMCYMNKMHNRELRVAALQTYRRSGCPVTEDPWKILEDGQDDVEVRLAAYLAMVPCATETPGFFTRIQQLLEREEVNQVGSFIWTHVRNLAEQPGPSSAEQELAKLASQHTLNSKFNTNAFRTSRNYRYAQFSEIFNIGGSVDSDVIFTPDSYLPRHASVNFTFDFLDKSFNIFEVGGDFSGMEDYIERLFGEGGYFENPEIQGLVGNLRPKREVQDERIEEFQRMYNDARTLTEEADPEAYDPKASVFFRIFGNEVFYMENLLKADPLQALRDLIREFSVPRSFQLLNQEYVSSTLIGFPIRLKVNSTGSVTFNREGTFEVTDDGNMLISGRLNPSAVLALDETLMVDGYGSASGIRRRTTQVAHASLGGKIEVKDGQVVDIRIETYNSDVAKYSSSVHVLLYNNYRQMWEGQQHESPYEEVESCSPELVNNVLGLEFCNTWRYTVHSDEDNTVITEPYAMELTVSKADDFDHYQFSYTRRRNMFEILFDTPGSSVDRKINLNINLKSNHARGTLTIPGSRFDVEGQYEYTSEMKKLALKYSRDTALRGEMEISLQTVKETDNVKYSPKFMMTITDFFDISTSGSLLTGPNDFMLEGNIMSSFQDEPAGFKAFWSREGSQNKVEGQFNAGQSFATASGTVNTDPGHTMVQLSCEYGASRSSPHSLTLSLDSTSTEAAEGTTHTGSLVLESSQTEVSMNMDYDYRPGYVDTNTTLTVRGTEVTSHVGLKNIAEGNDRDFLIMLSCTSQDLDIDYLLRAVYKKSNNAFLVESEVNLGSFITSKASLTYLFENDPLHLLAGLHLQFNDFVMQAGHTLDFSQSNRGVILLTVTVGPASAGFHFEGDYDPSSPFNASLDVFGTYDTQRAGVSFQAASDQDWRTFSGDVKLHWFDWTYMVAHRTTWDENKKEILFTSDRHGILHLVAETLPNLQLRLVTKSDPQATESDFEMALLNQEGPDRQQYETYITCRSDKLFHLTVTLDSAQTFSSSLRLLESQLLVRGHYDHPDADHLKTSVQMTFTQPSGETFTSDLHLAHTYDGSVRDIKASSTYNGDVIEGQVKITNRDGWFSDDSRGLTFIFTTPFNRLRKVGFAFEAHGNPAAGGFAEFEWDELKIRGESQMSDDMEVKLQYEDGGTCDSHFHLYHKYDGEHYVTGASLALTPAHDPWKIELITTKTQEATGDFINLELNLNSPINTSPFQIQGMYKFTDNEVDLELQAGTESDKTSLSFTGRNELDWSTRRVIGSLEFNSPWTQPVTMNITNIHDEEYFNVTFDLRSSLKYINTIAAEFSANYAVPEETKAHFYLSHKDVQATMEMTHKLSDAGLKQHLHASLNTMSVTYESEAAWGEDLVPTSANGRITLADVFGQNMDLSLRHSKEAERFTSQLFGTWDVHTFHFDHTLDYYRVLEWTSNSHLTIPNYEDPITLQLILNAQEDLSTLDSNLHLTTPWTKNLTAKFYFDFSDPNVPSYRFDSLYGDITVFNIEAEQYSPFAWEQVDVKLKVKSQYFEDVEITWKHNFKSNNHIYLNTTYGSQYHIQGESNLQLEESYFGPGAFLMYNFTAKADLLDQEVHFQTGLSFDSQYRGDLEVTWGEYIVSFKTDVPEGIVFKVLVGDSEGDNVAELTHHKGNSDIPNLKFRLSRNDSDVFLLKSEIETYYPHFEGMFIASYYPYNDSPHHAEMKVTADMSNLEDYGFKGNFRINSDYEGFENFVGDLDFDLTFENGYTAGHLTNQFEFNEWHYSSKVNCSLNTFREFQFEYHSEYDLSFQGNLYDMKELSFLLSTNREVTQTKFNMKYSPDASEWSFFSYYHRLDMDFKGYIIPGNARKYELTARIANSTLTLDAQRTDEFGSRFTGLKGNINWNIKKVKKQFTVNMNSDIPEIKKITLHLIIQQRRGLTANAKLKVNQENFVGSVRYMSRNAGETGRIIIKMENEIYYPFNTETTVQYSLAPNDYRANVVVNLNEKKWASLDMKASLKESYLKMQSPFPALENVDIKVNLLTEEDFGLTVTMTGPKFCFNFEGSLNHAFISGEIKANYQEECSGASLFDFSAKYDYPSHTFEVKMHIQDIVSFDVSSIRNSDERTFKAEITFSNGPSYGVLITGGYNPDNKSYHFELRVYNPSSDSNYFLFTFFVSENRFDVSVETTRKIFHTGVTHNLQRKQLMLEGKYFSDFFEPFNAELSVKGNFDLDMGEIEVSLLSDDNTVNSEFTMNYDLRKQPKSGNFKLSSPIGDAEGHADFTLTNGYLSVTGEMLSTLHSFHEYTFKFEGNINEPHPQFQFLITQDNNTYEITGDKTVVNEMMKSSLFVSTPFHGYEHFEFSYGKPVSDSEQRTYHAGLNMTISGDSYGIDIGHSHHIAWSDQETEISIFTPRKVIDAFKIGFMYNVEGEASVSFDHARGRLGLAASFRPSDTNISMEILPDLTFFNAGEYLFVVNIPLAMKEGGEIRLERHQTDFDFVANISLARGYKSGQIVLKMIEGNSEESNTSYSLGYMLRNPRNIQVEGVFENWEITSIIKLKGKKTAASTGNITVTTNIPGYEDMDAAWDIGKKKMGYFMNLQLDMKGNGNMEFKGKVDNGSLDIQFTSTFTRDHHLLAEYQINPLILKASYQYGLDKFEIDFDSQFGSQEGMMKLIANLPLPYVSKFQTGIKYSFSDNYDLHINAVIEQILFESGFSFASDGSNGDFVFNLITPFTNPTKAKISWSVEGSPVKFEAFYIYGHQKGGLKLDMEHTNSTADMNINVRTPFDGASEITFNLKYDGAGPGPIEASIDLNMDYHNIKISTSFAEENDSIEILGNASMDFFGYQGHFELTFNRNGLEYNMHLLGTLKQYDPVDFSISINEHSFQSDLKYGDINVLMAKLEFYSISIQSAWSESHYFNFDGKYESSDNNHQVELSIEASEIQPVTVQASYSSSKGHEGNVSISYGDKQYDISGNTVIRKKKSGFELHFTSSEDPYHPFNMEAQYNVNAFIKGNMNSMDDLAAIMLEWGDKIEVSVTGMRKGDRAKVNFEAITPFKTLPQLRFGWDAEFLDKRNLTQLTVTTFVEWTQRITLSGFFKSKNNEVVFNCSLNTPFVEVQKLSANFTWKPNQAEASFIYNDEEWKMTCNYQFSQTYSVELTAQTPLDGYELITFNATTEVQNSKFMFSAEMTWPEENTIHLEVEAQMWNVEMKFSSPWAPFQEVTFEMSLQTESEEGRFNTKLECDVYIFFMTVVFSPMQSHFDAKFQIENNNVFGVAFEYNFSEDEFRFDGEITTPVTPFEKIEAKLRWSSSSGKFDMSIEDFKWVLEAQNEWREFSAHIFVPWVEEPFNIIFKYEVQPESYKFSSNFEVSSMESKEKWVFIDINFEDPWTIKSSIFNTNIEMEVTKPNRRKFNVNVNIESQEMGLESMVIDAAINHKQNFKIFSITSTMSVKPTHGEATKHELIMDYEIISNHFSMKAEVHSDYIDVPYGFICKVPLTFVFGPGTFNFAVTREGEQVYKVSFDTLFPDDETETRILKIKSPEWSLTMTVSYSVESFSFTLSYPDAATEHTLQINWNEDISFEKVIFSLEMNSPYLKENTFLFEMNFNVRAMFSFVIDGKAALGSKQLDFTGQFQYNKQQQQVQFDAHVSSDWTGKHSLNCNIQWQRDFVFTVNLKVDGEDHKAKLTIDSTTYTMRMTVTSSWMPNEDIVIVGTVNEDFTPSNMNVEARVTSAGDTILEGTFENQGFQMIKSEIRVNNKQEVFHSTFEFENSDSKVLLYFTMNSIVPELNSNLRIHYDDRNQMREFNVYGNSYLTGRFNVRIENNRTWYKNQKLSVQLAGHSISVISTHGENGRISIRYDKYAITVSYALQNKYEFEFFIQSPLPSLRKSWVSFNWPQERRKKTLEIAYVTEDDDFVFTMSVMPDPVMGWASKVTVITPYKGHEMYELQTPHFGENSRDFVVMIEYPGGKVGAEAKYDFKRWTWCDVRFAINLPLEKYEIVSLKYIVGKSDHLVTLEGRVGKVGFTYSLKALPTSTNNDFAFIVRINEMRLQTVFRVKIERDLLDLRTHTEMQTETETNLRWLDTRLFTNWDHKLYFKVESNEEEIAKLHMEWGSDKIFAITTSKNYPAFLILNLENSEEVNECRVKVGIFSGLSAGPNIDSYGFHFRQEVLEGGHHISLSGDSGENNFYAEGTLSMNYHHLNESLVFELNKNRIGYRSIFQIHPGIFKDEYEGAVELMLPAQTVHWNTSALCGPGDFDLQSRFTWNNLDQEVPAVNLMIKYDDQSHFGQEEHHITAVFSHPEIKDIVLQGNITQSEDSTLSALLELIDENVPERNVVLAVDIHPYTENRTRDINATITQSFSGFSVNMDAQITDSNFHDGVYEFKYWSLTKETWEDLHVSTRVQPSEDGFDFEARVNTPKGNWGYTYRGSAFSNDHVAALTLLGISDKYGDFWEIETTVSKHLPEFTVHLDIGQKNEEPYEKGRLRIGLHNPLEIGAALDHRKFGEWRQDGAIGLRLKTEDILQFVLEFDPSLDYQNEHFLVDLVSPADQIISSWERDLEYTTSTFMKWFVEESPIMYQVLVNNPTLVRVWNAERNNIQEFVSEMNGVISDIHKDGRQIWNTVIQPSLNAVRDAFNEMREQIARTWEAAGLYLNQEFSNIRHFGEEMVQEMERWQRKMEYELTKLSYELSSWWNSMTHRMAAQYNNLMYHLARALNTVANAWHENWVAVERAVQPYIDSLVQSFTRYGVELDAIFGGQCYKRIVKVFDETVTTLQQEVSWMNEFLQIEEYYNRFLQAKETLASWAGGAMAIIEGGLQNLQNTVQESPIVENFRKFQRQTEDIIAEMKAEGTFHYFEQKISELGTKIRNVYGEAINLLKENIHTLRLYAEGNIIFDYINAAAGNIYERMVWTWERWNQEERHDLEKFERVVLALIDGIETLLLDMNFFVDESIVFEPSVHGRIEYNQHLPVPWTSFLEYPQWHRFTNIFRQESPVRKAERLLAKESFELASGWWALSHLGALRPPFSATGTIIGQHVTTFDLQHYQFLGSCSYLLTKDFVGGDFEVIGEYESMGGLVRLKSVIVRGEGTDVTLHVDGTVEERSVAGQVLSGGDYSAVAFGGLFVTCNKNTQGCSVTVSGKYFGRLAGLLGNYNYEPSDDWRGPDGTEASASTWSVSPEACYEANQAIRLDKLRQAEEGIEECSSIFLDSGSRFSNCFEAVDPRPYFWHCVNHFNRPEFDLSNADSVCSVASAYRTQCLTHKISLPSLVECGQEAPVFLEKPLLPRVEGLVPTCDVEGEEVPLGWSQKYEAVSKGSADVALVIELAACHKGKDMQKLFKLLKVQMKKAGTQDAQYALVTTAGRVSNVSSFMTGDEIESQLSGLPVDGAKSADKGYSAVLSAAKELKWRPGVSRTILHLSCQPCETGENLAQVLKEHDITYHIVTKVKINVEAPTEKRSKAMAAKVFGFDETFVYTAGDFATFRGNTKIRALMQQPGGACITAAEGSGGSVFNGNKWVTSKALLEKKFLRVMAQRVSISTSAPDCQECQCTGGSRGTMVKCYQCSEAPDVSEISPLDFITPSAKSGDDMDADEEIENAIIEDIRKDFKEQFIEENTALENFSDADEEYSDESESDEDYSEEEQYEEEEEEAADGGENYDYYEY